MVIRGGLRVGVMEGILVIVGGEVGVRAWSSVGDGVLVIGIFTTRVTKKVSTWVTSLVTSTVWGIETILGGAIAVEQEALRIITTKAAKPVI
jgi:hypothetical protein